MEMLYLFALLAEKRECPALSAHPQIISPWTDFVPERYRIADFAAYHRQVKEGLLRAISKDEPLQTYPDPKSNCDICTWRTYCDKRRRDDDHLCLVAGISSMQIAELKDRGITTATALAKLPLPLEWKPERGSTESLTRVREQARIQLETRNTGQLRYELLAPVAGFGLNCLPEPCEGDIFLDFEGDSFVGQHGLEYLLGFHFRENGEPQYHGSWSLDREGEKAAFETFIDFVLERRKLFPQLHVYHYGGYEPGALKRLMGLTTRKCILRTLGENLWRTRVNDIMRPRAMKACATGGAGRDRGGFRHSNDSHR